MVRNTTLKDALIDYFKRHIKENQVFDLWKLVQVFGPGKCGYYVFGTTWNHYRVGSIRYAWQKAFEILNAEGLVIREGRAWSEPGAPCKYRKINPKPKPTFKDAVRQYIMEVKDGECFTLTHGIKPAFLGNGYKAFGVSWIRWNQIEARLVVETLVKEGILKNSQHTYGDPWYVKVAKVEEPTLEDKMYNYVKNEMKEGQSFYLSAFLTKFTGDVWGAWEKASVRLKKEYLIISVPSNGLGYRRISKDSIPGYREDMSKLDPPSQSITKEKSLQRDLKVTFQNIIDTFNRRVSCPNFMRSLDSDVIRGKVKELMNLKIKEAHDVIKLLDEFEESQTFMGWYDNKYDHSSRKENK